MLSFLRVSSRCPTACSIGHSLQTLGQHPCVQAVAKATPPRTAPRWCQALFHACLSRWDDWREVRSYQFVRPEPYHTRPY